MKPTSSEPGYCVPSQGAQDAIRQGEQRHMPVRLDIERKLLLAVRRHVGERRAAWVRAASSSSAWYAQRHHRRRRCQAEGGPLGHQPAALVEEGAATIRALQLV